MTLLQNEVKLAMLDNDSLAFIKIVQKEWTGMMTRSKTIEKQLTELSTNQDGILKCMHTLKAQRIGTLSDGLNSNENKSVSIEEGEELSIN